jgi:hypothetical protein
MDNQGDPWKHKNKPGEAIQHETGWLLKTSTGNNVASTGNNVASYTPVLRTVPF